MRSGHWGPGVPGDAAERYGSVPREETLSATHLEFRHARLLHRATSRPRLLDLVRNDVLVQRGGGASTPRDADDWQSLVASATVSIDQEGNCRRILEDSLETALDNTSAAKPILSVPRATSSIRFGNRCVRFHGVVK